MRTYAPAFIDKLAANEVFVFGSNLSGFHGAGSAGYAMYGSKKNEWRTHPEFQAAYRGTDKRGRWAILGTAQGYQEGRTGRSYAIATVESPQVQGKITLDYVFAQVLELNHFAKSHPDKVFLCSAFGLSRAFGGYAYFTLDQMRGVFERVDKTLGLAENVRIPKIFEWDPILRTEAEAKSVSI